MTSLSRVDGECGDLYLGVANRKIVGPYDDIQDLFDKHEDIYAVYMVQKYGTKLELIYEQLTTPIQ